MIDTKNKKFFIDSSSEYFILALIDENNIVKSFLKEKSNNDLVKNSIKYLKNFLDSNGFNLFDIDEFFIVNGPGFFTSVKISYNIVSTINILNNIKKINIISSINLLNLKKEKKPLVKFSKNNYYTTKRKFLFLKKIIIINNKDISDNSLNYFTYNDFSKEDLQETINLNRFKKIKNINRLKIIYKNTF